MPSNAPVYSSSRSSISLILRFDLIRTNLIVRAVQTVPRQKTARAIPPERYLGASLDGNMYGVKKCEAFPRPLTSDNAADRLIRGRGMVDEIHAKPTTGQ